MNFYDEVKKASGLPDKGQALRTLIDAWREKSPLVGEVVTGRTSFADLVEPVVAENLEIRFPYFRGDVCRSEEYQREAKALTEHLKGLISLDRWVAEGRLLSYMHLAAPVRLSKLVVGAMFSIPVAWSLIPFVIRYHDGLSDLTDLPSFLVWGVLGGCALATLQFLMSAPEHIARRKELAQRVRSHAEFLDRTIREIYPLG